MIFYNQTQDERLATNNDLIFGDIVHIRPKFKLRGYANASQSLINYFDPTGEKPDFKKTFQVGFHDLDFNAHLSNFYYFKWIWGKILIFDLSFFLMLLFSHFSILLNYLRRIF